jgi:hypothetical protein
MMRKESKMKEIIKTQKEEIQTYKEELKRVKEHLKTMFETNEDEVILNTFQS